jgi:hypothetical protein
LKLKILVTFAAAGVGVLAAVFWYVASTTEVAPDPDRPGDKSSVVFISGDHRWDVIRTAELQTKWNKRAALAASVAAILQSWALFLVD